MKCWKLPTGHYLIEGNPVPFPTSCISSLRIPDGEVLHQATPYYEVTNEGQVLATYGTPHAYSLEDVLYLYDLHAVTDGRLCRFLWQEQWGREAQITVADILLKGLTDCPESDVPFDLAAFGSTGYPGSEIR